MAGFYMKKITESFKIIKTAGMSFYIGFVGKNRNQGKKIG